MSGIGGISNASAGVSRSSGGLDLEELFLKGYNSKKEEEEDKFAKELTLSLAEKESSARDPGTPPYPGAELLPEFYNANYLPDYIMEAQGQGVIIHQDEPGYTYDQQGNKVDLC